MTCFNCGKEIADYLKQCPECGMPTQNVPLVKAPVSRKKKKKKDPDKTPRNIPGSISLIIDAFAMPFIFFAILSVVAAVLVATYYPESLAESILSIWSLCYLPVCGAASIAGLVFSLLGFARTKCTRWEPQIGVCFAALNIISVFCSALIFIVYVLVL